MFLLGLFKLMIFNISENFRVRSKLSRKLPIQYIISLSITRVQLYESIKMANLLKLLPLIGMQIAI